MRILIVRHAEPDYTIDGLTEKGKREAELLSKRLERIPVRDYYVSPLGRARDTAEYTLKKTHRQAIVLPWLTEFRGRVPDSKTGEMQVSWNFPASMWATHTKLYDKEKWVEDVLLAGGNVKEIWQETKEGIDSLLNSYSYTRENGTYRCINNTDDTLMLFCHFAIAIAIIGYLINMSPFPMWHGILLPTSSVTTLITQEREPGRVEFRCVSIGDVSHLLNAGETPSWAGMFPETWNGVPSSDPADWPEKPTFPMIR